ncbi:MAG: Uma2 family endonuclease [Treponema sp.]|jgi:Uma2 family endonuclease|nr:Uma2 family endonuclease [Treponema sp.]
MGNSTYADYKRWDTKAERYELIYGDAYAMSAPNTCHQAILTGLFGQFFIYLQGKPCKLFPAPFDVRLFYEEDESDDTVVQPDITVICDKTKIGPEGCRGAPDLVIEILSPSNTAIEMEHKRQLYQDAGVREYWVIDPEYNSLFVYRFQAGMSPAYSSYKSTDTVSTAIFPDFSINLARVFAE